MDDFSKLDTLLRDLAGNTVPSCACAVALEGEIVYEGYYGAADLETRVPAGPASIYRLASMTKLVTYTILMMLYEQGRILLTQPVSDFFPEWHYKTKFAPRPGGGFDVVPLENQITVKDALTMTCGMPYCFGRTGPNETDPTLLAMAKAMEPLFARGHYRIDEVIRAMADVPVAFEPGTHWLYGFGSELIAGIVEQLTGMTLNRAMQEYIFSPLSMRDTDTLFRDDLEDRLVSMYTPKPQGFEKWPKSMDKSQHPGAENEEGKPLVMSNVRDFTKLMQLWAGGGVSAGRRLIREETLQMMRTNLLEGQALEEYQRENGGYNAGYGYGCGVRTLLGKLAGVPCGSPGSFGWTGGFGTWCEADPVRKLSVVYMHNMMPNKELPVHHAVRAAAYGGVS